MWQFRALFEYFMCEILVRSLGSTCYSWKKINFFVRRKLLSHFKKKTQNIKMISAQSGFLAKHLLKIEVVRFLKLSKGFQRLQIFNKFWHWFLIGLGASPRDIFREKHYGPYSRSFPKATNRKKNQSKIFYLNFDSLIGFCDLDVKIYGNF